MGNSDDFDTKRNVGDWSKFSELQVAPILYRCGLGLHM